MIIPDRLKQTIRQLWGDEGQNWINRLPDLLEQCRQRWSLQIDSPFAELSYNFVAPARTRSGIDVVIKLGVPRDELTSEAHALSIYDGKGCVRLLDADIELGVLLIERVSPGLMLARLTPSDDDRATEIAAELMRKLWRPLKAPHIFQSMGSWTNTLIEMRTHFKEQGGPFNLHMIDQAERFLAELIEEQRIDVLLHGDLHHFNILKSARDGWLAIDPKGIAGDPAFDAGAFILNPAPMVYSWPNLPTITARRIAILSDVLMIDRRHLTRCCLVFAMLANGWAYEDHGRFEEKAIAMFSVLDNLARFP